MLKNSSKLAISLLALPLAVLTASPAFAGAKFKDPLIIADSVTVKTQVKPDIMTGGFSVAYKAKTSDAAANAMDKAALAVKKHDSVCTFSGYGVNPEYVYKDGVQNLNGYTGSMDSDCKFNDVKQFESAVNDIYDLAQSDTSYIVSMRPVRWEVSEPLMDAKKSELKLAALRSAFKAARQYSAASGHQCYVKDISFDTDYREPVYREMSVRAAKAAVSVTEPDNTDTQVSVTAKFSAVCR